MVSYLSSLVQFSPAAGRAGRCRQTSLCVGSTRRVPATLGLPRTGVSVLSLSTLLRLPAALYGAGPALSVVPVFGPSTKARIRLHLRVVSSPASAVQAARGLGSERPGQPEVCVPSLRVQRAFSLRGEWPGQPEAWAPSPRMCRAFSLGGPSTRRRSGLRKSSDRNRGLFAGWEGVASLGLSLPPCPSPASYLQRGWAGSSLEFLSPFVL